MIKYTEEVSPSGTHFIRRIDEDGINWCIPVDPANSDYQAYLKSLEEQANDQSL